MKIKKMYQGNVPENKILNTYSDSQIDVYSCNYVNKLNTYSTTEQRIGTWFGKPLYRKTVTKTIASSSTYNETTILEDASIEQVTNMYGVVAYNNGVHQIGAYANSNYYSLLQYNEQYNKVYFYGANNYVGYTATVTIEYTKTTD